MGSQSIVHGRIHINDEIKSAKELILSLGNDEWMLRTEMFGTGISDPFNYEDSIIVFGATYKQIEYHWSEFIFKFESLLRKLNFDTAKIQLETEILGTYNFFWKSKEQSNTTFELEDKLIETDDWFFGYGNRSRWGLLTSDLQDIEVFDIEGFKYPLSK